MCYCSSYNLALSEVLALPRLPSYTWWLCFLIAQKRFLDNQGISCLLGNIPLGMHSSIIPTILLISSTMSSIRKSSGGSQNNLCQREALQNVSQFRVQNMRSILKSILNLLSTQIGKTDESRLSRVCYKSMKKLDLMS